ELKRDVELPAIDTLLAKPWNTERLLELFQQLEFQLLVDKLQTGAQMSGVQKSKVPIMPVATPDTVAGPPVDTTPFPPVEVATDAAALAQLAADARAAGTIGLWVEGSGERAERD